MILYLLNCEPFELVLGAFLKKSIPQCLCAAMHSTAVSSCFFYMLTCVPGPKHISTVSVHVDGGNVFWVLVCLHFSPQSSYVVDPGNMLNLALLLEKSDSWAWLW